MYCRWKLPLLVWMSAICLTAISADVRGEDKDPKADEKVALKVVDAKGLIQVLQQQQGKVILIDYWATWCAPCLKQLPHSVELQHKYAKQGLVVVTMSLDEPDEKAAALEVLKEHKAALVNLLYEHGSDEKSFTTLGITDGALPHYQLFDRQGKLAKKISAQQPADLLNLHEQVDVAVKELVLKKESE